ncbi:unnamed protein product [Ceratitis capitata]|uniref:(Mediterranean fruit fly) hypothetical protein n=1 Tax=Ceratitis capitata TaxID=7213 RepID=A0A811UMU7_CERCA|nr:unnamed protein product [Ceratitis capitata]
MDTLESTSPDKRWIVMPLTISGFLDRLPSRPAGQIPWRGDRKILLTFRGSRLFAQQHKLIDNTTRYSDTCLLVRTQMISVY